MTYEACGKQVLRDGRDFAQACSNDAAQEIADAMNEQDGKAYNADQLALRYDETDCPVMPEIRNHAVRQESDEYACSCGRRWDVAEGSDHP